MPDFIPVSSQWDRWEDWWYDFMAWFHSEDAYYVALLLLIFIFAAIKYD